MAKVSLEENSIQKIFHDLKDKYDHLITYLHAKNETACTLKAHVELKSTSFSKCGITTPNSILQNS